MSELVDDEENLIRIESIDMMSSILPLYSEELLRKCEVVEILKVLYSETSFEMMLKEVQDALIKSTSKFIFSVIPFLFLNKA